MTIRHPVLRKQHLKTTITLAEKNDEILLELTAFYQTREQLGVQITTADDCIAKSNKKSL